MIAIEAPGKHVRLLQAVEKGEQLTGGEVAKHTPIGIGGQRQRIAGRHYLGVQMHMHQRAYMLIIYVLLYFIPRSISFLSLSLSLSLSLYSLWLPARCSGRLVWR